MDKKEYVKQLCNILSSRAKFESNDNSFTVLGIANELKVSIETVKLTVELLYELKFIAQLSDKEYIVHLSFSDRFGLFPEETIELIVNSLYFEPETDNNNTEETYLEPILDIPDEFSKDILQLLILKQSDQASENIVNYIRSKERIYTTRDDIKAEMWIYHKGIYVPEGETYINEYVRTILKKAYSTQFANRVVAKLQADSYISQEEFFKEEDPNLVPVLNGILNVKTKKLSGFSPEYIFFNKLPVLFDRLKDCVNIKKFFSQVVETEQDVAVLQELFGYVLYRNYFIEKSFMFLGSGRNGKGKTMSLLRKFVGYENCVEVSLEELEADQYALDALFKKLVNICGDISKTALKNTGRFKKITGRDQISAQRKYKTKLSFINFSKQIFAANELPIAYDTTFAFFNRWLILDFPFTFLDKDELSEISENKEYCKLRDPNIIENISTDEEMSGLLNWALIGLERLLKSGSFSYSPSTEATRVKWVRNASSFSAFIMDCLKADYDEHITKSDLKKEYSKYCRIHKLKMGGDKTIKFLMETEAQAFEDRLSDEKRTQIWQGVKFVYTNSGLAGLAGSVFSESIATENSTLGTKSASIGSNGSKSLVKGMFLSLIDSNEITEMTKIRSIIIPQTDPETFENVYTKLLEDGIISEPRLGFVQKVQT